MHELVVVERLRDVVDGAALQGLDRVLGRGVGRDHDDGRRRGPPRGPCDSRSRPLPSGILMSQRMTSGFEPDRGRRRLRCSWPRSWTSKPCLWKSSCSMSRSDFSSSTISIRGPLTGWPRARPPARPGRRAGRRVSRQENRHGCPFARLGFDVDRAPVVFDDAPDDRHAEPGAAVEGRGEGREDAGDLFLAHPPAGVAESDAIPGAAPRGPRPSASRRRASRAPRSSRRCRRSAGSGRGPPRAATARVDVERDACARPRPRRRAGRARGPRWMLHGDVEDRDAPFLRPHEAQELLQDLREPVGLRDDDLHQAPLGRAHRELVREDLHRARDRRERVADLVGDAGGELADGRELLVESGLALELLHLGQVLENDERPVLPGPGPSSARTRVAEDAPRLRRRDLDLRAVAVAAPRAVPDLVPARSGRSRPISCSSRPVARAGTMPRISPPAWLRNVTRWRESVGDEPRRHRRDDVGVEGLDARERLLRGSRAPPARRAASPRGTTP